VPHLHLIKGGQSFVVVQNLTAELFSARNFGYEGIVTKN